MTSRKKLKNNLFVIVLLLVSTFSFANESLPIAKIFNAKNKTFTISTQDAPYNKVNFIIRDMSGVELYEESISVVDGFKRKYNLSNLPNGTYQLELGNAQTIRTQIVIISSEHMEILNEKEVNIFKPAIKTEGMLILFNMLVLDQSEVEVIILNEDGIEVHREIFKHISTIHKQFNLSKFPTGSYTVLSRNNNTVVEKTVNLK